MTHTKAATLAQRDIKDIKDILAATPPPHDQVLADGSMFAPALRILDGYAELYALVYVSPELFVRVEETYLAVFDAAMDELGCTWYEGCLYGPDASLPDD